MLVDIPVRIAAGAKDILERFLAIPDHLDRVRQVIFPELVKRELLVIGVVLDHEDVYAAVCTCHSCAPFNVK